MLRAASPGPSVSGGEVAACDLKGIVKRYATGVLANDHVDFTACVGEVHALIGENGAGKTTLMRGLYGMERPDAGSVRLWNKPVRLRNSQDAIRAGIGMVHQHFMLVPSLTVAENVVLGHEPGRWRLSQAVAEQAVRAVSEHYGLPVPVTACVSELSVGERQRVEVIKALYRGARLLILDEPTAVLTAHEADELFAAMRRIAAAGGTVIFITHRLGEVCQVADRVTVMRQGRIVGTFAAWEVSEQRLAGLMVGSPGTVQSCPEPTVAEHHLDGEVVLEVRRLCVQERKHRRLDEVSLNVRSGEIVGIVGIEGNGQRELAETLSGLRLPSRGEVRVGGCDISKASPCVIREAGVAVVPEDRLGVGLAAEGTVAENVIVSRHNRLPVTRNGWLMPQAIRRFACQLLADFEIQAPGPGVPVRTLSGGNMQRLILARELATRPRLLIAAQPTRGLDIAASMAVHERLRAAREGGSAVLLISADLDEVTRLADRVLVLVRGRVSAEFSAAQWRQLSGAERGLYLAGLKGGARI